MYNNNLFTGTNFLLLNAGERTIDSRLPSDSRKEKNGWPFVQVWFLFLPGCYGLCFDPLLFAGDICCDT